MAAQRKSRDSSGPPERIRPPPVSPAGACRAKGRLQPLRRRVRRVTARLTLRPDEPHQRQEAGLCARGRPVRSGQVRSGQVRSGQVRHWRRRRASARSRGAAPAGQGAAAPEEPHRQGQGAALVQGAAGPPVRCTRARGVVPVRIPGHFGRIASAASRSMPISRPPNDSIDGWPGENSRNARNGQVGGTGGTDDDCRTCGRRHGCGITPHGW
jgi:hypothetical protein